MTEDAGPKQSSRASGLLAGGGIFAGIGALLGASCCVLPILLVQAGMSAALVAQLGVFARAKPYLLAGAAVLLVASLITTLRRGGPRPRLIVMLIAGALLVGAAYVLPSHERALLEWLRTP